MTLPGHSPAYRVSLAILTVSVLLAGAVGCAHRRDVRDAAASPSGSAAGDESPAEETGEPGPGAVARPPGERRGERYFPPSGPETDGAWVNVRVNQDASGYDQAETVIAANPNDPLNLVAAAIDDREGGEYNNYFYTSHDGGQTWTEGNLDESLLPSQCDPAVAFCADGTAVFAGMSYGGSTLKVYSYRSTDGGDSWIGPTEVSGGLVDKPWLACDTTDGHYKNRAYVCHTRASMGVYAIKVRYSRNAGKSWSSEVLVSEDWRDSVLCGLTVAADGAVHVAWKNTYPPRIAVSRSTDGGTTFTPPAYPEPYYPIPFEGYTRPTFPILEADRSDGPHSGNVYIVWNDQRFGDADIVLTRSTDGGVTWSDLVRVNDDPMNNGRDQWLPWISVDPKGRVIVTWLDRRRKEGMDYEVWGAISRDGGQTFDTNFLISDLSSNPTGKEFIGDYSGLAATIDRLYPLWPDLRSGTGEIDVYTDRFPNTFDYDEVANLVWPANDRIDFDIQDDRFGEDLAYDLASGYLSELHADRGFDRASCAAPNWPDPPIVDDRVPPLDDGFWYLVRATGANGVGTYGDGTPARPNVRDPLDETFDPCP